MHTSIYNIPVSHLLLVLIPIAMVIVLYTVWTQKTSTVIHATVRMVIQLLLVGFVLVFLFDSKSPLLLTGVLSVMLIIASIIAVRPLKKKNKIVWAQALISLVTGCVPVLALAILGILRAEPWYEPKYLIPVGGMIFANSMNAVSLAAERFESDRGNQIDFKTARGNAYRACLLPLLNVFFAAGLVSLPGMMTGQILAGVSPLIAVRYQVMIMGIIFGAAGLSAAIYLYQQTAKPQSS